MNQALEEVQKEDIDFVIKKTDFCITQQKNLSEPEKQTLKKK